MDSQRVESATARLVEQATLIRALETRLLDLYRENRLGGTVHTCIGQEFCAAALYSHIRPGIDAAFSNHRGHGHFLACGGDLRAFLAELLGREGALCGGRGGSQHLHQRRFFSNGIQGGIAPLAVGYAWAQRMRQPGAITVAHLGDGTLGEGTLYEALTMAGLLRVPVLFVCEHNGYAQSTDTSKTTPGDLMQRIAGFGIEADRSSDRDPDALHAHLGHVVAKVRSGCPFFQIIDTRRLMAHSKGDDTRPTALVDRLWREDPLQQLIEAEPAVRAQYEQCRNRVESCVREVLARPPVRHDPDCSALPVCGQTERNSSHITQDETRTPDTARIAELLNRELHALMGEFRDVVLLGEDVADPYGGAFKITRGLSTAFPQRVFSTPIAEAGIVGVANGLALAGLRPVAEIMFADFVTLAADQLVNHAAKFHYMYGQRTPCPITVRLVSGGGRGYGPTHSQSLEGLLCGVPGLRVIALSQRHDPGRLLRESILDEGPTIFVEHKSLYGFAPETKPPLGMQALHTTSDRGDFPALRYATADQPPDVTVVTFGYSATWTEAAMRQLLIEEELACDYFVLTQLWPLRVEGLVESVRRTGRLVTLEEGVADYGVGAAVIAAVSQAAGVKLCCRMVGARPVPIPAARHLEDAVLPDVERVVAAIRSVVEG
jgi:2-oxoisovalerate dehydrogenase E1 component